MLGANASLSGPQWHSEQLMCCRRSILLSLSRIYLNASLHQGAGVIRPSSPLQKSIAFIIFLIQNQYNSLLVLCTLK